MSKNDVRVENTCDHCEGDGWVATGMKYSRWEPIEETYSPCEHCEAGRENKRREDDYEPDWWEDYRL